MILFDRVSFCYNANIETSFVLKEVSFTLKKGVVNGLIGKNGCGKSTIARLIVGLLEPNQGKIVLEDDKEESSTYYFSGMIFQNPENQIVGTTVGDDIAFGLENLNLPTDKIKESVVKSASLFGFENILDEPVSNLSGGQKQMLCIASVLALEPSWIVFDEPTSHLDPWTRLEFWKIIDSLVKENKVGVIIISQLPEDINHFNHILVLDDGKIAFNNSLDEFKKIKELPKAVEIPDGWKLEKLLNKVKGER